MTNLERAVYLATTAVVDRWPKDCELTIEEKWQYYREIIHRLEQMLPDGKEQKE